MTPFVELEQHVHVSLEGDHGQSWSYQRAFVATAGATHFRDIRPAANGPGHTNLPTAVQSHCSMITEDLERVGPAPTHQTPLRPDRPFQAYMHRQEAHKAAKEVSRNDHFQSQLDRAGLV